MRSDARSNRHALIAAARRLFAQVGTGVPLRTVASEAQVGIGTLYRHFPTRDDLIIGLVEDTRDRIVAMVEKYLAVWNDGPAKAWTAFATEFSQLGLGVLAATDDSEPAQSATIDRIHHLRAEGMAAIDELLDRAKATGLVAPTVEPERFAVGLAVVGRPLAQHVQARLPAQADWLIGTYLRGLRDPGPPEPIH